MSTIMKDSNDVNKILSTSATSEQSLDLEKSQRKLKHAPSNNSKTNLSPVETHSPVHGGSDHSGSGSVGSSRHSWKSGGGGAEDIREEDDPERRRGQQRAHHDSSRSSSRASSVSSSHHRTSPGRASPLTEEEGEDGAGAGALPWHHVQLYNFMGAEEADYFLHPKLDVEKRSAKPMSTRTTPLQSRTVYSSVDELWTALRSESSKKLTDVDNNAPQELKATYRAYIREFMKSQDPEGQDDAMLWGLTQVPDLVALLDDRRARRTAERHRRAQVMFRSSVMNEERTKILLHNSPLPAVNDRSGGDCIARFLPLPPVESCTAADNEESTQETTGTTPASTGNNDGDGAAMDTDGSSPEPDFDDDDDDDGLIVSSGKPVRCVFLTEADASSAPGAFSRKRRELEDARAVDMHWTEKQGTSRKASSGMKPRIQKNQETGSRESSSKEKKMTAVNIDYQPLTLGALMEYAAKCPAPGEGSFKFGGRPMWKVQ